MSRNNTDLSKRIEKVVLTTALALVAGIAAVISSNAQAQAPRILLQCVAPLVPNSDGSDCVRPTEAAKTCPRPTILDNGRCSEPKKYIRFSNCTGPAGNKFSIAYYANNKIILFRSSGSGSELTQAQAELTLTVAKDSNRGSVYCENIRG